MGYSYDVLDHIIYCIFYTGLRKMSEPRSKSPQNPLKRSQMISSPKNNNSRLYLPSRYAQERKTDKVGFQDILNSIQTKTTGDNPKIVREASPLLKQTLTKTDPTPQQKKPKTSKFKSRPLKRQKNDQIQYKQIFLNPREDALQQLRKKSSLQDNMKTISKQYEKLLRTEKLEQGDSGNFERSCQGGAGGEDGRRYDYLGDIQLLESGDVFGINIDTNQRDFYDNHILIQPPDFPVSQASQSSTHSPSIPTNYKSYKTLNLKQLLMRARAGMSSEDIQKQAHLSYILGEVYSQKKMFQQALKFHRRFLGFAKSMEDYVGMSLGANRVAISYYNCGEIQRSILFHNENLKLSNNQNCFVGFYNIGIAYRKLNKLDQALEYFESALAWSQERGEQQSECIALGQMAVTYQCMQQYQKSIQTFQKSNSLCLKTSKPDLKLHNLRYILRMCSMLNLKSKPQIQQIVEEAFTLARDTGKFNVFDIFRGNMRMAEIFGNGLKEGMEGIEGMEMEVEEIL